MVLYVRRHERAELLAHGLEVPRREHRVGRLGEEAFLELALLVALLLIFAGVVGEGGNEPLPREQLGRDLGAGVHDRGMATDGSRLVSAGASPLGKKRHPAASSSLLILMRAVASFMGIHPLVIGCL